MNDVEKIAKLVSIIDTLSRCEDMLEAICDGKDPEDLRTWEDDTLAELETLIRGTLRDYNKARNEYLNNEKTIKTILKDNKEKKVVDLPLSDGQVNDLHSRIHVGKS